jgi:hypothetical protein
MIDIAETPLVETMMKDYTDRGYEVIRYQCVNDANDVSAICRTPYGGTAEIRCEVDVVTSSTACPLCNNTMLRSQGGLFVCADASHAPLYMSTPQYQPLRRASVIRKPAYTFPNDSAEWRKRSAGKEEAPIHANIEGTRRGDDRGVSVEKVDMELVKSQLREALEDLL